MMFLTVLYSMCRNSVSVRVLGGIDTRLAVRLAFSYENDWDKADRIFSGWKCWAVPQVALPLHVPVAPRV